MIKSVSSTLLVVFAVFSAGSAFKLQPRIFKGISSTRGQFPYYAYLSIDTENGLHDCGGTILNERFILTAAHCIHNAQFVDAFLGTWKIADASEQHRQMHTVSRIIPHEQFSYKTGENDIALLELPAPIEFNEYVKAVNLSRSCDQTESLFVMLIGNGVTEINQNHAASVLQWAPLQTASKLKCKQYYPNINHETAFCAGSREGRAATLGKLLYVILRTCLLYLFSNA